MCAARPIPCLPTRSQPRPSVPHAAAAHARLCLLPLPQADNEYCQLEDMKKGFQILKGVIVRMEGVASE